MTAVLKAVGANGFRTLGKLGCKRHFTGYTIQCSWTSKYLGKSNRIIIIIIIIIIIYYYYLLFIIIIIITLIIIITMITIIHSHTVINARAPMLNLAPIHPCIHAPTHAIIHPRGHPPILPLMLAANHALV